MEEIKNTAIFTGRIQNIVEKEKNLLLEIKVREEHFFINVWDTALIEKVKKYKVEQFVKVLSYIKNNNWESEGKITYSYDFVLMDIELTCSRNYSRFQITGKLLHNPSLHHFDGAKKDFISLTCTNKYLILNTLFEDFNENISLYQKNDMVKISGTIAKTNKKLVFYAKELENI